jgi:hypothetical protein
MRSMLRRRLQESTAKQWSDANLNTYLNFGLQFMQQAIMQVSPEEFLYISTADHVADDDLIPKPYGLMLIKRVQSQYAADASYTDALRARNDEIDALVTADLDAYSTYYRYAEFGRHIRIWPTPESNNSAGMRLSWVPTLTMAVDADVPDVHLSLHEGIVYRAHEIALADTDEITDPNVLNSTQRILQMVVSRIPLFYYSEGGMPTEIEVDVDKEGGWI